MRIIISMSDALPFIPAFPKKYNEKLKIEMKKLEKMKKTKAEK